MLFIVRVIGMIVTVARMLLMRLSIGFDLQVELGDESNWVGFDLFNARRAADKNLTTVYHCRFCTGINWLSHYGTRFLSRSKVALNGFPMLRVDFLSLAATTTKKSSFFFAYLDFDWFSHRTELFARNRTGLLNGDLYLVCVGSSGLLVCGTIGTTTPTRFFVFAFLLAAFSGIRFLGATIAA